MGKSIFDKAKSIINEESEEYVYMKPETYVMVSNKDKTSLDFENVMIVISTKRKVVSKD